MFDPVSAIIGGVGVGMQVLGMFSSADAAADKAAAEQRIIGLDRQVEGVKHQWMVTDARRKQMEMIRQMQTAQALALANSTGSGQGRGSSGLRGGYAQIAGQTEDNLAGVEQNVQFGQRIFDINAQITEARIAASRAGSQMATASGLSSLGGSLIGSAGTLSNMYRNFTGWGPTGTAISPNSSYGGWVGSSSKAIY